jgi:DNA-directed RNA polymerase I, II, and III subunit RPABC1
MEDDVCSGAEAGAARAGAKAQGLEWNAGKRGAGRDRGKLRIACGRMATAMSEGARLWRVRKTLLEMLRDRNYIVRESDLNMTLEEFQQLFGEVPRRDELEVFATHSGNEDDSIIAFFPDEKPGVKTLNNYVQKMRDVEASRAILVLSQPLTAQARNSLSEVNQKYPMEQFVEQDLLVNITKHQLVPQHVVLSEDEKRELLRRYKVYESQLPRIQTNDPVARYYGLRRGNVVRILRPSETAGKYVTYRVCV